MLDNKTPEELAGIVMADKRRLDEIANTTPRDMRLAEEYEAIYERIVENERQINAIRQLPRAYPLDIAKIHWDQRTDDAVVVTSQEYPRTTLLYFVHSASALDRMNMATIFTFSESATARLTQVLSENLLEFPLGMVGLDRLGMFVVEDSVLVSELTNADSGHLRHFCFVFEDAVFECVATSVSWHSGDRTSVQEELVRVWSEFSKGA